MAPCEENRNGARRRRRAGNCEWGGTSAAAVFLLGPSSGVCRLAALPPRRRVMGFTVAMTAAAGVFLLRASSGGVAASEPLRQDSAATEPRRIGELGRALRVTRSRPAGTPPQRRGGDVELCVTGAAGVFRGWERAETRG